MNAKLITLQKRVALRIIEKLEHSEIDLSRASVIAKFILQVLPEDCDDTKITEALIKLETIPELKGVSIAL